ncbi:hypothetical protein IV57_GL002040 [Companilactobacillus kimchiensis]|uniref:Uncharacterized protein n=2 Tax=Companilactobacillus kimchiensis TaxID=993692 RepID=A0A0R2LDY2_9LACO|nr:hypothetical protein IV57_GL002040 [Companilactobacillus kimchiensis]
MNWIVGIELIAFVVIYLLRLVTGGWNGSIMPGYFVGIYAFEAGIVSLVGFVMLSRSNEQVFTSNNYRLIPASDTKLYFSNILTTVVAYLYLQILEAILGNIVMFASGMGKSLMMSPEFGGSNFLMGFELFLVLVLGALLLWTGITVIHFLINWISGFLPFGRQKLVTFILYFVVTWIALVIFNFTTGKVISFLYKNISLQGISNMAQFSRIMWLSIAITFVWVAIFTAANIYLLKRWTETTR